MSIEDDKLDKTVDKLDAGYEPSDEELAQMVAEAADEMQRQGVDMPVDVDEEWDATASRLGVHVGGTSSRRRVLFYAVSGVAAMLLIFFAIRAFVPRADVRSDYAYTRIANAPKTVVMSSGDKHIEIQGDSQNISVAAMQPAQRNKVMRALGYETDDVPTESYTINIPVGKSYTIVLADGTQVWMYTGSRLTYPSQFIGDERNVYLYGEAYFKVAKDAEHPFVITTENAEVRVLGTELNVSCYNASSSHVALITGSAEVKAKSSDSFVRLVPGQGATITASSDVTVASEDMVGYEYWRNGYIYFDDASLMDVALAIGRWYNVNVDFTDKTLQDLKLRYFCRRDESLRRAIDLLNGFESFSASLEGETLKIGKK
ncbi:MAG: FecR family protein [Prevotella sp.]